MKRHHITLPNDTQISYLHAGNGPTTLLFLHGWAINADYWTAQITHFSPNYSIYAPELTGFGASTANRTDWSIEAYARDINAFITALDLQNVVLVGHSMSGPISVQSTLNDSSRIKGLVGIDNFKVIDMELPPEFIAGWLGFLEEMKVDYKAAVVKSAEQTMFHPKSPRPAVERVKADFAAANPAVAIPAIEGLNAYSPGLPEKLAQLPIPLHLLNGDSFPTYEPGLSGRLAHGYGMRMLQDCGHYPMIE